MSRRNNGWTPYRNAIEDNGLFHYEVAMEARISPYTMSRWLRENPTKQRQEVIGLAIKSLIAKRNTEVEF